MATNIAEKYSKVSALIQRPHGLKLIEQLSVGEGQKVLDLGCGTGELTAALAEKVGSKGHVTGVDPDRERIEIAREKNSKPNITFLEADGETFPQDQYDLVFSNYVLHWIKDKDAVFKRVSENLRPGGKFAFIIVNSISPLKIEMSMLMGETKGREIIERLSLSPSEEYVKLAKTHGLSVTLMETDVQVKSVPSIDNALELWSGVTHGRFDSAKVDQEVLKKFKQKYSSDRKPDIETPTALFILAKQ